MTRKLKITALTIGLGAAALVLADALAGAYVGDTQHSQVSFSVPVAGGIAHLGGRFNRFDVSINYSPNDLSKAWVKAVIDVKSLDTGIPGRDNHTLGRDGFWAAKYPNIIFQSTKIVKNGTAFDAFGNLSLKGVTKPIVIHFRQTGTRPLGQKLSLIGFEGDFNLDRRDYGLRWQFPGSSDWIGYKIDAHISILARPQ